MGFRITWMGLLGAAALAGGCALRGQLDILESRLRQQEDSITQLQGQLSTSQSQLQAARRESTDLRTQLADGTRTARVEQVSALGQVEAIELNRFLTGGLDKDGAPGDEIFSAVIVPTDSQGNLVKAPGSVAVTLFDLTKPEAQQRIGRWEFSPKESEKLWHSGFLGSGYIVPRPVARAAAVAKSPRPRALENDRRPPVRHQPVDPHRPARGRLAWFGSRRRRATRIRPPHRQWSRRRRSRRRACRSRRVRSINRRRKTPPLVPRGGTTRSNRRQPPPTASHPKNPFGSKSQ